MKLSMALSALLIMASTNLVAQVVVVDDPQTEEKITCPEGFDHSSFKLVALNSLPAIKPSEIGEREELGYELQSPTAEMNIRLDVCINGMDPSDMMLGQAVIRSTPFSPQVAYKPSATSKVNGLVEAILDQNYEKLKIEIIVPENFGGIRILGLKKDQQNFVVAFPLYDVDGRYAPSTLNLLAGTLELGNPWPENGCNDSQIAGVHQVVLGTATFDLKYCFMQGAGETTEYYFTDVTVTDTNPALSKEEQKSYTISGVDKLKDIMEFAVNHHNGCDSFYLKLPHAEYAASAAPMAGCGLPVKNAPKRDMDETSKATLFQIRYHGGEWNKGEHACWHYLLCRE